MARSTEMHPKLVTLRLPIRWEAFGLPARLQTGTTCLVSGDEPGWAWQPEPPEFQVPAVDAVTGQPEIGWDLDHVVLLVPRLDDAVDTLARAGLSPRLRLDVEGRPAAFFRVGPLLEVIESPVRSAALFGVALVTHEALEVVALRWRSQGHDVSEPRAAIQPGRRILTVRGTEAGLAVMSADGPTRSA